MTEQVESIGESTQEAVDETEDEVAQAIQEIRSDISSMRVDIAALRGENHEQNQFDAATGHENPENEEDEDEDDPPVIKTSKKPHRERDPYLFERRPVRKHSLFRRLFG